MGGVGVRTGRSYVSVRRRGGDRSIRFCTLLEGHDGLHLNGTKEWGGNERHPIAKILFDREAP